MIEEIDETAVTAGIAHAEVQTADPRRCSVHWTRIGSHATTAVRRSTGSSTMTIAVRAMKGQITRYQPQRRPREPENPPPRERWRDDYAHQGGHQRRENPSQGGVRVQLRAICLNVRTEDTNLTRGMDSRSTMPYFSDTHGTERLQNQ